jgi:vancomycin permeability regulator SanA
MEDLILYPTVIQIFCVSMFVLGAQTALLSLMKTRMRWQLVLAACLGGVLVTTVSLLIRSTQSTGDGYLIFRGWPHWYRAEWRDFATGDLRGGWRIGAGGVYVFINILYWSTLALIPIILSELKRLGRLTKSVVKHFVLGCMGIGLALLLVFGLIYAHVQHEGREYIGVNLDRNYRVAIVFGAGLWNNKTPSDVLRDRVTVAANLYQQGSVEKLLMSGDNRFVEYNEPEVMRRLAVELGVPNEDIILDYAGRRTYDTCYRAHEIFGLQEAVLVTNRYHLPRALYTCAQLGVEGVGIASDIHTYASESAWRWREVPASVVAWLQVHVTKPEPILGEPLPID